MDKARLVLAVLVALLLGAIAGMLVRRWTHPPEVTDRARGAAQDLKLGAEKATH